MPIKEGNPVDQAPAATAPAPIDYGAIGTAVADSLRASGLVQQPQNLSPAQTVSAFQEAIKAIEANPENDRDSLNTLNVLFNAQKADQTKETQKIVTDLLVSERVRQAHSMLDAEIARVVEADEDLAGLSKAVRTLAIEEFDNSKEHEQDRLKVLNGTLDATTVRKLVAKKFNELRPAQTNKTGLTGMTTQGTSPAAAAAAAQPAASKVEDLNERQKELFYAIVAEQSRVGLKQLGKTQAEVEADAMKRASQKFR